MKEWRLVLFSITNQEIKLKRSYQDSFFFTVQDFDLNLFFPASRLLLFQLKDKKFTQDQIKNISYIKDKQYIHFLRYVAIHSFCIESSLYIPVIDVQFDFPLQTDFNQQIFLQRYQQAKSFNIIQLFIQGQNTDCIGFQHQNPQFIILHLQDYMPFQDIDQAIYGGWVIKNQQKWSHYYVPRGQFPSDEVLSTVKGILIPGAKYCSFDFSLNWMIDLHSFVKKVYEDFPKIKLVGICLGHQIINHTLGGTAGRNPNSDFIFKAEEYFYTPILGGLGEIKVMECHQDCVRQPFCSQENTASSQTATENERVFTIQGHPEFNGYWFINFYVPLLFSEGQIDQEQRIQLQTQIPELSSDKIFNYIDRFLRSQSEQLKQTRKN